jgi:hypothetical protein
MTILYPIDLPTGLREHVADPVAQKIIVFDKQNTQGIP